MWWLKHCKIIYMWIQHPFLLCKWGQGWNPDVLSLYLCYHCMKSKIKLFCLFHISFRLSSATCNLESSSLSLNQLLCPSPPLLLQFFSAFVFLWNTDLAFKDIILSQFQKLMEYCVCWMKQLVKPANWRRRHWDTCNHNLYYFSIKIL